MLTDAITKIDFRILDWIHENCISDFMDSFMVAISFLGNHAWFFFLFAFIFLFIRKYRESGLAGFLSIGMGYLFGNLLIKNIVARTRPYDYVNHIDLLVDKLSDYSFPSGHTLVAFEFFAVVCYMPIKIGYKILAGILAFLMGFSRLYLYVHYPSDVLGGMILGFLFGMMGVKIVYSIMEEKKLKKKVEQEDQSIE